jgi:hypothetical protein
MRAFPIIAPLSFATVAAAALSCGGDRASRPPASDAAAGDASTGAADVSPEATPDAADDSSDAGPPLQPVVATQLLDDMRGVATADGAGPMTDGPGTSGVWYTYSDRDLPYSNPDILVYDGGLIVPSATAEFSPTDDGEGPTYRGAVQPYRECSGGGEIVWGIGFGMDFADGPVDVGDKAVNHCDAGGPVVAEGGAGDSGAISIDNLPTDPVPFDVTGWTGIQLWGRSLRGIEQPVKVFVDDDRTKPSGLPVDGGGCNVCKNLVTALDPSASSLGGCGDGYQAEVTFATEWTQIQVPFASMHPEGWSGLFSTSEVPNVSRLYDVHFQIELAGFPALPPFDVAVAYVELYR